MFRLHSPFRDLIDRAQRARDQLARGKRKLLEALGVRLLARVKESVEIRSQGGAAAGIHWQPLDRDYAQRKQGPGIGIATGRLFESAESEVSPKGVAVQFTAAHAPHFARRRPLLPRELPPEWQGPLEEQVAQWADDVLQTHLLED